METMLFHLFAGVAVILSLAMIMAKKPVTSAVCLVGVMFALAALFALLNAHLIAALQILVYAGAIMVLFMFVIMLLNLREKEGLAARHLILAQITGAGLLGALLIPFMMQATLEKGPLSAIAPDRFGTTAAVGELLYTEYLLPFEIASALLLAALVGAVALVKIRMR